MKADPKNIVTWVLIITVPVAAAAFISGLLKYVGPELISEKINEHFAAIVALPMAALLSAFIVVSLRFSEGPVKFEALGMKFEGASGQVILWVICFISISLAIKLLW